MHIPNYFSDEHGNSHRIPEGAEVHETDWAFAYINHVSKTLLVTSPSTKLLRFPGQEVSREDSSRMQQRLTEFVFEQTGVRLARCRRIVAAEHRFFYHKASERFCEANVYCFEGELEGTPPQLKNGCCWMPRNRLIELCNIHPLTSSLLEKALGIRINGRVEQIRQP